MSQTCDFILFLFLCFEYQNDTQNGVQFEVKIIVGGPPLKDLNINEAFVVSRVRSEGDLRAESVKAYSLTHSQSRMHAIHIKLYLHKSIASVANLNSN